MENSNSGGERRHLTWRDLPASPPLGPTPEGAAPASPVAAGAVPMTPRSRRRGRMAARAGAVFAAGALAGAFALFGIGIVAGGVPTGRVTEALGQPQGDAPGGQTAPKPATSANPAKPGEEPIADAAAKLAPSVVQIETGGGLGAGFVADKDGYILTASHVVGADSQVTIRLKDNTTLTGAVVAVDRTIDTAVVKVDRTDLPAATLGTSGDVRVGQSVIAIGSPFGFEQTVTTGIVSGLDRTLTTEVGDLTGLIQTDAPINPGNSGGPLADKDGNVIGINTAIASSSGGSNGVGFAIPIDTATDVLRKVKDGTWTAADNQPADVGGGTIPGLPFNPNDLNQLFGPDGPLGPDGLFGPNGLFGDPNGGSAPNPAPSTPQAPGSGNMRDQLFRWLFNYLMPQVMPGAGGSN